MTGEIETLADLSKHYKDSVPADLREAKSFEWYLEEVYANPKIARNAHQRVADMFDYYGTRYDEDAGVVEYLMASEDPLHNGENVFYGREVHESIHEFVNKVKSGARGLGPEKRIKLLLGPVGSGKSHFDWLSRRYFEDYTMRDEGRMYTFRWSNLGDVIRDQDPADDVVTSPMNQDPLVLLPQEQRDMVIEQLNKNLDAPYTIRNDQALDPASEFYMDRLLAHYDDDLESVLENHIEIIRLVASENKRQCIETFEPKDKKNQDETELTGDVNYSKLAVYGESDPRAFDYAGAFCNANRGIFSGEELLKLQREFLYDFLHASQEQTIKPKNNPRIDIDQVIVGRTNMPEYREKKGDEKMEAFNDRTKRIDFPYVLEYEQEAEIYRKMLRNADVPDIHVEPHTLEMSGLFGVLTRIVEPDSDTISLVQKAKAYNGELDDGDDVDVRKLREEGESKADIAEGMDGVSARFIGDEIAEAIMDATHRDKKYLSPLSSFTHLGENLETHGSIPEESLEQYHRFLEMVREEYKERAIEDVRHALAYDIDEIQRQGEKYMDHVMAYIDDATVEDELTGRDQDPDEKFLRAVEEKLNIPEDRKEDFRQEVSNWVSRRAREGTSFNPQDNDRLRRALERKLWEDKKHNINFSALVSANELDDDERNSWIDALVDQGYSRDGAREVLEFAGAEVAKSELEG
ncbi:serine protein kinase PrkA [Haloferax mediterranei ATCC 33500]|uniref:Serine protein kinase n=1 Tax=Haloferax mediterranei (strain ATCC 33500 / DSM 1411 / JCM 8866 / NBRC 14739 / NCIMB 2177 / R-4) TaxID=523841 RepID=I3R8E9_HALMT|nr:serine protein kinase PrkA [Haloferax mediterranei]AFK20509.1 serine protein kinase [Haloferax mediterranei ATCC 33500]AHZ23868.1 serine/threonine protein kinase [Haloferax mediterranei ATCC 33500]ELZ98292.1 serine protein kinase, PrkA [Haloferax mediterranei ATCC 33500]MDX5986735.1 serine protein kinase PrkA [Haloferax mediterranei ATCC 33500]QCQ76059.1 serine protein kinase PrkA [Haloferax mediterranei ATCC 33500]